MTILYKVLDLTRNSLNDECKLYLQNRGINAQSIDEWEIGYLPDQNLLADLDDDLTELYTTMMLVRKVHISPLHKYITFPLYDQYGQLIGFSGRPPLSNEEVKALNLKKYWHSQFEKRKFLFGLNKAIPAIRETSKVIVGEGQFDSITAHQHGIHNIVSTCGTALTHNQVILLSRYATEARLVFDNDEAGQRALGQLDTRAKEGIQLKAAQLPLEHSKDDIDSFIRKYGPEAFLKIITVENTAWDMDV